MRWLGATNGRGFMVLGNPGFSVLVRIPPIPILVSARKLARRSGEREFGCPFLLEDRGLLAIWTQFAFDSGFLDGWSRTAILVVALVCLRSLGQVKQRFVY